MALYEQRCSVTDEQQRHQAISATRRFAATVSRQQQQQQQQHASLYLQQCKQRKSFRVRASKTFAYNVREKRKRKKKLRTRI